MHSTFASLFGFSSCFDCTYYLHAKLEKDFLLAVGKWGEDIWPDIWASKMDWSNEDRGLKSWFSFWAYEYQRLFDSLTYSSDYSMDFLSHHTTFTHRARFSFFTPSHHFSLASRIFFSLPKHVWNRSRIRLLIWRTTWGNFCYSETSFVSCICTSFLAVLAA